MMTQLRPRAGDAFDAPRPPPRQQQRRRQRDAPEAPPPPIRVPVGAPHSARSEAIFQLLRIEQEGAFAGLVSGRAATGERGGGGGGRGGAGRRGGRGGGRGGGAVAAEGEGEAEEEWDGVGGGDELDARDLRKVKELVAGVTRWRRRLDYIASELTGRTADDLEPAMRQVLRLGLYEITHTTLAPHALNEHVDLAKIWVRPAAAGFANGVLREAARRAEAGTLPDPESMPAGAGPRGAARRLGVIHSHPTWLVARWLRALGEAATLLLLAANNARPSYSLRANAARLPPAGGGGGAGEAAPTTASAEGEGAQAQAPAEALLRELESIEGVSAAPSPLLPSEFVRVASGLQSILRSGLLSRGACAVQDESTGLVVALLDPRPGEALLDACAAPGNKTLLAAARMRGEGRIWALDASPPRLHALLRAADAQGHGGIVQGCAGDLRDAAAAAADGGTEQGAGGGGGGGWAKGAFDRVLLDAPCSGTGVLAKRADLRWRRTPDQISDLVALQDDLIAAAAVFVRPGGLLVYSTCSIEPEECIDRVRAFLESPAGAGFELEAPPAGLLPPGVLTPDGCLATLPHVHGVDGAFGARLRRRAARAPRAGSVAAAMLESLESALVVQILQHLLPPDYGDRCRDMHSAARAAALASLRAARQTCKLFDELARVHLLHTARLTPDSVERGGASGAADGGGGGGGGPDWARFPALRTLRLEGFFLALEGDWYASDHRRSMAQSGAAALRVLFVGPDHAPLGAAARRALAAVTALDLRESDVGAASLQMLTARLPGLKELRFSNDAFGVVAIGGAAGAQRLERLSAPGLEVDATAAAALARLPALRALTVHSACAGDVWDVLPCSRLTRLHFMPFGPDTPLPLRGLGPPRFPHLQELRGVALSLEGVSALAHSAPRLRLLICIIDEPAWPAGAQRASLPTVTHAYFSSCEAGFPRGVNFARLLPAVQDLALNLLDGAPDPGLVLGGLTGLRALAITRENDPLDLATPGDLAALARLTRLTRLACAVDARDPAQLAHLARLTGLQWDFGALARFAHAAPPLRRLKLWGMEAPPLGAIGALAMHTRLQRLALPRPRAPGGAETADAAAGAALAAQIAATRPAFGWVRLGAA
ncbi:MAG: hypothetical protein J3K34DRAFT_527743 [Monoraphidium minutum]|nr:MAG: hypothetical protein J3K34DRAFT_527743 [Monoraphidium minutum]